MKLLKPYTGKEYAEFAHLANQNSQRVEQDESSFFALYDYEKLENGQIVDVSESEEYIAQKKALDNNIKRAELQQKIAELDLKRVRAIAEPQLKDSLTGQTWLEFYTNQICDLRLQISALV